MKKVCTVALIQHNNNVAGANQKVYAATSLHMLYACFGRGQRKDESTGGSPAKITLVEA